MDKAQQLISLAKDEFAPLGPADEKLFRAVAYGQPANYSSPNDEDNDPANAESWPPERAINADRIIWLCTDKNARELVNHKGIWVRGARIDGELDLKFANIPFPLGFAKCRFPAEINLQDVRLPALNLPGTHTGPLHADGLTSKGGVFLRNGFKATSEVQLIGAKIDGDLDCSNARFINKDGPALIANRIDVAGSVFLSDGFTAKGGVQLLGATIGRDLDCHKGRFINECEPALIADEANVKANIFLRHKFRVQGRVSLVGALAAGGIAWTGVESPEEATLDLRRARIGTLWDELQSWPKQGNLLLHGLVYDQIDQKAPTGAKTRIDWLKRQPDFWPQPYEQLAGVLKKSGHEADAKKILIEKERTRAATLTWYKRIPHAIWGLVIGYGYRPWRAAGIGLAIVLIACLLFDVGFHEDLMKPTKEMAYVYGSDPNAAGPQASKDYPKFNAIVYSLDVFLPLVDLHQCSYWLPNAHAGAEVTIYGDISVPLTGSHLRWCLWLEILSGWLLTTFLVASLTKLART